MNIRGEAFVPPTCPVEKEGRPFPLSSDEDWFIFIAQEGEGDTVVVDGVFEQPDDIALTYVRTDVATIPVGTEAGRMAKVFQKDGIEAGNFLMGEELCKRVRECRGLRDNHECWALGKQGIKDALQSVFNNTTKPSTTTTPNSDIK